MREEIEQAFDMHAVDIYGLSEVVGPGVAQEFIETKMASISGRIISTLRSLIRKRVFPSRMESRESWSLHHFPRKLSLSCAIARVT